MSGEEQAVKRSSSNGLGVGLSRQMATKAEAAGEPNAKEEQEVKVGSDDVEEATEEHEHDEQDGEEWRRSWNLTALARVSKQEREEHERTHMFFRAWWPYCVTAGNRNRVHKNKKDDYEEAVTKVPRIAMDYFFMLEEDSKANKNGDRYAKATGQKAVGSNREMDQLVEDMSSELNAWRLLGGGENALIMKSDGERLIIALGESLAKFHGDRITPESPANGESKSNGAVEETGKTIRRQTKVMKEQVQDKAKTALHPEDPVVQWMIRWSVMLTSRFSIGRDGRSAFERRRGRKCKISLVPMGEKVWHRESREGKDRKKQILQRKEATNLARTFEKFVIIHLCHRGIGSPRLCRQEKERGREMG